MTRTREEILNTATHAAGLLFTFFTSWYMIWLGCLKSWQHALGVSLFIAGMMAMYACSTIYHWGKALANARLSIIKTLRKLDHISIYVMIAASYSPICLGVLGSVLGWTMFAVLWAIAIGGTFYKIFALGRWPALSLGLYLAMGWSGVILALPIYQNMAAAPILYILAEGLFYTIGTYFYSHDSRKYFHAIWHIFVLLGSIAHWIAVLLILLG